MSFLDQLVTFWLRVEGQRKQNTSRKNLDQMGCGCSFTHWWTFTILHIKLLKFMRALCWGFDILGSPHLCQVGIVALGLETRAQIGKVLTGKEKALSCGFLRLLVEFLVHISC